MDLRDCKIGTLVYEPDHGKELVGHIIGFVYVPYSGTIPVVRWPEVANFHMETARKQFPTVPWLNLGHTEVSIHPSNLAAL